MKIALARVFLETDEGTIEKKLPVSVLPWILEGCQVVENRFSGCVEIHCSEGTATKVHYRRIRDSRRLKESLRRWIRSAVSHES